MNFVFRVWILSFLSFCLFAINASAKFQGDISFTQEEVQRHQNGLQTIIEDSANCLKRYYADHEQFFYANGVSKYYGSRKWVKGEKSVKTNTGLTLQPIAPALRAKGYSENKVQALQQQMTHISCVELTMFCLKEGFENARQGDLWDRIAKYTKLNGVSGMAIQEGLQKLGWKNVYWNPDPSKNEIWDDRDKSLNPTNKLKYWGQHEASYNSVMNRNTYLWSRVDDKTTLVGFGTRVPSAFTRIPFFVGVAHFGYHVFPGTYGEVIEAHSTRSLFALDNLEFSPFNPLENGGGPRWTSSEEYRSGMMTVPPGYL